MKFKLSQTLFVFATFFIVASATPLALSTTTNDVVKKDGFGDAAALHLHARLDDLQTRVNVRSGQLQKDGLLDTKTFMRRLAILLYGEDNQNYLVVDETGIGIIPGSAIVNQRAEAVNNGIHYHVLQVNTGRSGSLYLIYNWGGAHPYDDDHVYGQGHVGYEYFNGKTIVDFS